MPEKSQNLVHVRWLLHLVDFNDCGKLSWGSTVLPTLYLDMCQAMNAGSVLIGGCLLLLQLWAWWRLPFLCPKVIDPYMFLLVMRWNHGLSHVGLLKVLEDIRLLLDKRPEAEFEWMSYADTDVIFCTPPEVLENRQIWDTKVPLIVYAMVEMQEWD
ncbi:hypothetical protein PVK06_012093 [Gossypium arboreum]|uniref:Aminotransferase-like plant mobile domain-containing protein n=1 Tax=Gossypium arboreum TaxID=29729 RepID=A0ABR0QAJ3_GOSAR|nr:hypothetical protein PVK06_012093 [Gossypium arboreum]